jgi:hypothetical protein
MGASLDEDLGDECEVSRAAVAPRAAMDEDHHRRVRTLRLVDVDLFDLGRPVGDTLRLAKDGERLLVAHGVAVGNIPGVEGIDALVVGVIDILLIKVEPDRRAPGARRRRCRTALR